MPSSEYAALTNISQTTYAHCLIYVPPFQLADSRGVPLIETSTKTKENVDKAFHLLTASVLKGFLEDQVGLISPSNL